MSKRVYRKKEVTDEMKERAKELLKELTLEEKIGMIHGNEIFATKGVERLSIPPLRTSDGPMGVRAEFMPDSFTRIDDNTDSVTYLPCNSAVASTWNRDLAYICGRTLGSEARGRGKDVILAPGVNIKRSPLCGRNFEYFSEDPYLTSELACEMIQGIQENDVAACVKHFVANNQETNRLNVDTVIDGEVLDRIYYPAFRAAVQKAGSYTVMGSYNKINGEQGCHNKETLKDTLRDRWGFDGVIISDWGGVHDTDKAAFSELDIEMDCSSDFDNYYMAEPLREKIISGKIPEEVIDEKVYRILILMLRLNMLDGAKRSKGAYNTSDNREACLSIARESVILLKNEDLLPFDPDSTKKVLVIGENADRKQSDGGGSAEIKALYEYTTLAGIRMLLGGNARVDYCLGYTSNTRPEHRNIGWQSESLMDGGGSRAKAAEEDEKLRKKRRELREEAISAAKDGSYDQVIFVGGLNHNSDMDCEGNDKRDMELPYEQNELIEELLKVRSDTVIVMQAGSAVSMERFADKAHALLWSYYAGMEGGKALAEILYGEVNPSGKLAETLYRNLDQCSAHALGEFGLDERVEYKDGLYVGYRYNEKYNIVPRFPFGFGLSYTEFEYREPYVNTKEGYISCRVCNTGERNGKETVQLYLMGEKDEPVKELAGFEKVFLIAGEEKDVKIYPEKLLPGRRYIITGSGDSIRFEVECEENIDT
ncbi:MAG: glycoside hydrolase family 3 C-terminal domain-containing protein [Lachnospiraceae bacterium]|nr:glycoside hydrolase family 3 C-terminal domain-containing protein [Lachnospiraceae bacterium]